MRFDAVVVDDGGRRMEWKVAGKKKEEGMKGGRRRESWVCKVMCKV